MELISRDQASQSGLTFYFTGTACKHGHLSARYCSTKTCIECHRLAMAATAAKYRERNMAIAATKAAERNARLEAERIALAETRAERTRERKKEWRKKNAERVKAVNDAWIEKNRERYEAKIKAWRNANIERCRAYTRAWTQRNPEKQAAKDSRRDPIKMTEKNRQWRTKNRDRIKIYHANRRALELGAGGRLSRGLESKLFRLQRGKCACCRKPLGSNYHMDHIFPLALGGTHSDDNMQLLTQRCNNQKKARHPVDFMRSRGYLL